jgi:CDP-diacylglycerol--serine O-phosphatidyltransferase
MIKKSIPNLLTLGNLICGLLAVRSVFLEEHDLALLFVGIAAVLDFFDGFAARLLGVSGELGKQLDSLADNVTFGVVPAFMFLSMAGFLFSLPESLMGWLLFTASLLVAAFATLRLAIFNIDLTQSEGFKGMPTPGNTLFVAALYYIFHNQPDSFWTEILSVPLFLLDIMVLSAVWQVLPVRLIALKFKTWSWQDQWHKYSFLIISVILIAWLQIDAIPFVLLLYLMISLLVSRRKQTGKQA